MSQDADKHSNPDQTDDQPSATDPATTDDRTTSTTAGQSSTGTTTPTVFYTTDAGGGENTRWAGSSGATVCANLAEGILQDVPTPSDPGKTLILAPSNEVAKETASQLEEFGYDVYRRGKISDEPPIVDGTLAYLTVLAASSPSDRNSEVRTLVEYFYGIQPHELVQQVEAAGHEPGEIDDTWTLLTTAATTESDTPGDIAERAALAVEDIETLREEVEHRSIQVAYTRLHDRLNLREYATGRETAGLASLAHAVTSGTWVDTETVVESAPPLSVDTVNELGWKVKENRDSGRAEAPSGHFEVGTIHSAKGDEAKTVVLVGLSDYWDKALSNSDEPQNFDRTVTEFTEDVGSSVDISFKHRQQDNARLLMYVAVSRAEERLVLLGGEPVDRDVSPPTAEDYDVPDSLTTVEELLPDVTGSAIHHPWSELISSLPDSAVDLGDVAGATDRSRFSLDGNPLTATGAASFLSNAEEAASDRVTLSPTPSGSSVSRRPRPLTYSALATAADNPARYYRRHVLDEPELTLPATVPDDEDLREHLDARGGGPSFRHRVVGDLVHFTAETLYGTDADLDAWTDRCSAIADTIEATTAELEQATENIERLFATAAMEYTVCETEIGVSPDINGDTVYGRVDAVVDHPERAGELLALDFKTGKRANADPMQLWFYLIGLAESDRFDRPVTGAAFVYLDETPEVADHVTVDDTDELDATRAEFASRVATANGVTHAVLDGGNK